MKKFNKILCFMVVFMVMTVVLCSVSFAYESQYTDNLIPTMTSNTAPMGIVSASDSYSVTQAWKAFDKNYIYSTAGKYNAWGTQKTTGWLAYEFNSPQVITKYAMRTDYYRSSLTTFPKTWNFEAWDGSEWIILDSQSNIKWSNKERKEFTFYNSTSYKKYRINILANCGATRDTVNLTIGELEMIGIVTSSIQAPTNLLATANNKTVNLSWNAVDDATSYNVKRATTPDGKYTTITTTSAITYIDTAVTNGTKYYYVVTAIVSEVETLNSNEVSATPEPTNQLKLVLEVNENKQLSISNELSDNTEMQWTSSDLTIATVDANGKVKALKSGNTVITCTSDDYTESINVLVVDLEYQLAVDLNVGDSCRLTVDDLANTTNVTWSSYDSTIATISAKGKVTAVGEGLTYIVASYKDGKEIGRIYIRVRN